VENVTLQRMKNRIAVTICVMLALIGTIFASPVLSAPKASATAAWQTWGYSGWTLSYRTVGPAYSTYVDYFQQLMEFNAPTGTVRGILFRITGPDGLCYNQGHFEQPQSSACLVLLNVEANTNTQYLSGVWNYIPTGDYCAQFVIISLPVSQRCDTVSSILQQG
jgi:hypothetical protein